MTFKGHFRGQDTGKSYCHVYIHEAYILLQILQPLASLETKMLGNYQTKESVLVAKYTNRLL